MPAEHRVPLATIAGEWLRIGSLGFGGPPAHIALLRRLSVQRRGWLSEDDFADGLAAANLLPGPASTQLAMYCAWRLRGGIGALVGGVCFIAPGLVAILLLAAALLGASPNRYVAGLAAGAGAAVAAVAVHAAVGLVPASWQRTGGQRSARVRWMCYVGAGAACAALVGAWVALVLLVAGAVEAAVRHRGRTGGSSSPLAALVWPASGLGAVSVVAFKVGALSYGGGFVIIPLMQSDAVRRYHWLTPSQFLSAVALGQVTPGPVVHTVAAVGYAAAGLAGGLVAAVVAFAPSFAFVMAGARHFDRLRGNADMQAFLTGAGPAAVGAIAGSAVLLGLALTQLWQVGVLILAAVWLFVLRRGVVSALAGAAAIGGLATLVH